MDNLSRFIGALFALVCVLFVVCCIGVWGSYYSVPIGNVGVVSFRGHIDTSPDNVMYPGPHFTAPWNSVIYLKTSPIVYEVNSDEAGKVGDTNGVALDMDLTIPYMVTASCDPELLSHLGPTEFLDPMIKRYATTALRDAASQFTWDDMMIHKRDVFTRRVQDRFTGLLTASLIDSGVPKQIASQCVRVADVQLQKIVAPEAVQNAVGEKAAIAITNSMQDTLDSIAQRASERRTTEGQGISNLMANLPKNFSASEVAQVMSAVAVKENSDAITRAVQDKSIPMMVLPESIPVTVHPPAVQ